VLLMLTSVIGVGSYQLRSTDASPRRAIRALGRMPAERAVVHQTLVSVSRGV